MPTLDYIRISKDNKLLLLGISEEGERSRYTVSESFYRSIGSPVVRTVIGEGALEMIVKEDERIRAMKKALSILSYTDNNEKNLVVKLVRAGFDRSVSAEVAREMVSLGYVDERRQLERLVLNEANVKLYGYGRILMKLTAKGYSGKDVRAVTEELVNKGEISFKENAKKLIEKRLPKDAPTEEKRKLLYRNGYKI